MPGATELHCASQSNHLRNLKYYIVTRHNLIYLTWFKSNQTGAISTSTFWENKYLGRKGINLIFQSN